MQEKTVMKWLRSTSLLCLWSLSFAANAQTFPNHPVKIIVP
jgi:tripartite-type tricarboxylate transporter receptor subunit TctC